ncbi:hypothetical protein [Vibrio sp. V08_P9A1T1]|uniref:hypothetical protein n=1 Tax=Vibrio sp. V08_P9A1T1 TaxID=1938663 RepID=UPI001595A986|nr:hypothetical protein [Vibrio sp. V08_P9A1T1]
MFRFINSLRYATLTIEIKGQFLFDFAYLLTKLALMAIAIKYGAASVEYFLELYVSQL